MLLDKRPEHSEIISYGPDEIAEIRRLTEDDLSLISSKSGTGSALNKETQAFLDSASIVRALSHVAEDRFEREELDEASTAVINAIRWQQFADGLYLSGGVTQPRINPVRLWFLLAEIYLRMEERELALKTMQKASASIREFSNPPFDELLSELSPGSTPTDVVGNGSGSVGETGWRFPYHFDRRALLVLGVVVLSLLVYTGFRAEVTGKTMVDHSSLGADYLNIAFGPTRENRQDESLILAAQEFAALNAKLDSWSWLITASSILPPVHDQFVGMDRMADLGMRITAAPYDLNGTGTIGVLGSVTSVCESADRLRNFDGNLAGQLEKNRSQILDAVPHATDGACN